MAKTQKDRQEIKCPNFDLYPHREHTNDDPILIGFGILRVLPRVFVAGYTARAAWVGLEIPVSFCDRCFEQANIPAQIRTAIEKYKGNPETAGLLELGSKHLLPKTHPNEPLVEHTIHCDNADYVAGHGTEYLGKTSDLIIRGQIKFFPASCSTFVDVPTWLFWGIADCCMYCLDRNWPTMRSSIMNKFLAGIEGNDLHNAEWCLADTYAKAMQAGGLPKEDVDEEYKAYHEKKMQERQL